MATWMVVEDETDLYEMLLAMMRLWGYDGVAFSSGEAALDWIRRVDGGGIAGELPTLALIDIRLPGRVSGIDVSAALRDSLCLSYTSIALMTAYRLHRGQVEDIMRASRADLLLYKPLPALAELKQILEGLRVSV